LLNPGENHSYEFDYRENSKAPRSRRIYLILNGRGGAI
jgi:hypothetical protein